MDANDMYRIGFKDGALEAEYVSKDFSFKTSIPLVMIEDGVVVERTRHTALRDLAYKIVGHVLPLYDRPRIKAKDLSYKELSDGEQDFLFSIASSAYEAHPDNV